ncbi:MAG: NAD(P)-dependent oxidoreductase [Nanoarchaeota archaeon]
MNILITGAFGYLGGRISLFFKKEGHEVSILSRRESDQVPNWVKDFKIIFGDVTDIDSLKSCCNDIDLVIHLAAINEIDCVNNPKLAYLVNCLGTQNMLEVAKLAGCSRFIYFSTFHVYGLSEGIIDESTVPNPTHLYGITHLVGEQLCKKYFDNEFRTIILRLSNGIGAPIDLNVNRWSLIINELCKFAVIDKKVELKSSGTQLRDFISIKDICQALNLFLNDKLSPKKNNIFNVGSGESISIKEVAKLIVEEYEQIYGSEIKLIIPSSDDNSFSQLKFRIDKIKQIGFNPTTNIKEEIKETLRLCEEFL